MVNSERAIARCGTYIECRQTSCLVIKTNKELQGVGWITHER